MKIKTERNKLTKAPPKMYTTKEIYDEYHKRVVKKCPGSLTLPKEKWFLASDIKDEIESMLDDGWTNKDCKCSRCKILRLLYSRWCSAQEGGKQND